MQHHTEHRAHHQQQRQFVYIESSLIDTIIIKGLPVIETMNLYFEVESYERFSLSKKKVVEKIGEEVLLGENHHSDDDDDDDVNNFEAHPLNELNTGFELRKHLLMLEVDVDQIAVMEWKKMKAIENFLLQQKKEDEEDISVVKDLDVEIRIADFNQTIYNHPEDSKRP